MDLTPSGEYAAITGTASESRLREIIAACDIALTRKEWYELYLAAGHPLP